MTIAMLEAPSSVGEKFNRAMDILAALPGRDHANTEYHHIGPFPKRVLGALPNCEADLASPYRMGWQCLVHDDEGFGVLDISSRADGSYSSFRRGSFALAYRDALDAAEADVSSSQEIHELEIVEIPSAFTLLISMKSKEVRLYPAYFQGTRLLPAARTLDELQRLGVDGRRPDGTEVTFTI
ncbi:hypothetical protein [Rhizobium sp. YS-1r]|uniref:hypothetical protein n=1 Tax=Rhizobium sp. YS-1r TaxID=1532558 RepID=UPI00051001D1|nr:hypothetical protein [Rhizobium sp. YS-1r]KGD99616.1 hypothetical protein JL39_11450 [Rhizobium sp. YS-1r]